MYLFVYLYTYLCICHLSLSIFLPGCVSAKTLQSSPTLCGPMDCSQPGLAHRLACSPGPRKDSCIALGPKSPLPYRPHPERGLLHPHREAGTTWEGHAALSPHRLRWWRTPARRAALGTGRAGQAAGLHPCLTEGPRGQPPAAQPLPESRGNHIWNPSGLPDGLARRLPAESQPPSQHRD